LTVCFKFIGLPYGEATSNLNHLRFRYKLFPEKDRESSKLTPTKDSTLYINASFGNICPRELSITSPDGNGWAKDEMGTSNPLHYL